MLTQHYPQGWAIRQTAKRRFLIEHDFIVIESARTVKEARAIIKRLLTH